LVIGESIVPLLQIAEIFGQDVAQAGKKDRASRDTKFCPFRNSACTKGGKTDPLGVCSFADAKQATTVCPVRFREGDRLFQHVGALAFGPGAHFRVIPEFRLLRIPGTNKKIGKIDYLLALLDKDENAVDFAALEVQSVYISGRSIKPAFKKYLKMGKITDDSLRRPDFRSSAQKRLMPQLTLKVPVFRRWGKKFFVAVDEMFFKNIPPMNPVSPDSSEVTWLVYPFRLQTGGGYALGTPKIVYTIWDDVLSALREGEPPEKAEVLAELDSKRNRKRTAFKT
jgi:hypothetical protein